MRKINKAATMKKKDAPTFCSHHYPPFADNYAGFFGVFPGVAAAFILTGDKNEN